MYANGRVINKAAFRRESAYVMQSDALFPLLTVRETLRYAALLRVHGKTKEEKFSIVENLIGLLKLDKCADTIIGDADNRGLSGGEIRRVSIGVDIISLASVVFLDEPTSGLDSSTAMTVVECLRTLAQQQNSTVVMTIHQPSARIFSCLDQVLFLSEGKVTYQGKGSALAAHVQQTYQQLSLGIPLQGNPPELFLDLCDILASHQNLNYLTDPYSESSKQKLITADDTSPAATADVHDNYANDLLTEVSILLHRCGVNFMRTGQLFVEQLVQAVIIGVVIGTLFLDTDSGSITDLDHRASYMIFTIAFFYYTCLDVLPIFFAEREIFQREYASGAYRALSYTIASEVVQAPFALAISLVYTCVTWWLVGMPNIAANFFFMVLCIFTVIMVGQAYATMFSTLVPNPMMGQSLGSGIFSLGFLFSGFFINKADIPDYWLWLHYSSLLKYAYDSMMVNAFKDRVTTDEFTNAQILHRYSVNGVNVGLGIGVLWGWLIVFRLVFYYRLITAFNGSRK